MTWAPMVRTVASLLFVLGLMLFLAWALRRGRLRTGVGSRATIVVETAVSLGERRSLVIVAVEGRRLLLGLATNGVSLLADLAPSKPEGSPS
jgi:flagellar biosynthetic protein FliO